MNLLRLVNPRLYDLLEPYRVTDDKLMPLAYQDIPGGRPLHDDFGIMGKFGWLQPWQKIKRIDTARRVPYPFRIKSGLKAQNWYPLDPTYPLSPGAIIEAMPYRLSDEIVFNIPHILIEDAVDGGGWTVYEAWINGEWTEVYKRYSKKIGNRMFKHYQGFKCDTTVCVTTDGVIKSDVMGWIEFPTFSFNKI